MQFATKPEFIPSFSGEIAELYRKPEFGNDVNKNIIIINDYEPIFKYKTIIKMSHHKINKEID